MRLRNRFVVLVLGGLLAGLIARADVSRSGDIAGTVKSQDGTVLPGTSVKLTGPTLIQRELLQTTDQRGNYRFTTVPPGTYTLTFNLDGFATKEVSVIVNVGRTASIDVDLPLSRAQEQLVVRAEAPLVDKTTPVFQTNYNVEQLAQIPSTRRYIDVVDTATGVDNRMAFGAGGNVDGYDVFGFGAATNQYQINGVDTSNLQFGNTWVNPNYDTVQEVQIVGAGASAEYAQFTGALVNVVTKTGTNQFHGGTTVYGWSSSLQANNDGGIVDLEQPTTKYAIEANAYLGGPIVSEKFMFFASAQYNPAQTAPIQTTDFGDDTRQGYQLRLDYLANNSNTLSAMYDYEPIKLTNQGAEPGLGPEVTFFREEHVNTGYFSWTATWSPKTITEFKYGGGEGYLGRIPANLTDSSVYDVNTGLTYNSQGFTRQQRNWRHEGRLSMTHYVDEFLGGNNEIKAGVEYEWQEAKMDAVSNNNLEFFIVPVGGGFNAIYGLTGYNYHINNNLKRPGVYLQDNITWKNVTVNLGARYDNPKTQDGNTGKTLLNFKNVVPRIGVSWDITGKGKTILGAFYGRYYDKVPTYGPMTYAGTGHDTSYYYITVTDQPYDPTDWRALEDLVVTGKDPALVFDSLAIPVVPDTTNPSSYLASMKISQQFTPRIAASLSYLYRWTDGYVTLVQYANPNTYQPFLYTSSFNGRTFPIYGVTGGGPRQFALGNMDFWYQQGNEVLLEVNTRPTDKSFLNVSYVYEHTTGTRDNNECGVLSLCTNGVDGDPNYIINPYYTKGVLSQNRPFSFKVLGSYQFPYNFMASADFRWFSGRAYGATESCFAIPGCASPAPGVSPDSFYLSPRIEPKDARKQENSVLLNMRAQKDFLFSGGLTASLIVDVLNITNSGIDYNTNVQNDVNAIYPRQSQINGSAVSAFGGPYALNPGRTLRLGARLTF
jgi:hypothetical protein